MEKKDFARQENLCRERFIEAGTCFHVCSRENHPVMFHGDDEFKAVMNIIAFVAFLYNDIQIFTFEVMSNHLHFALSGEIERIRRFLRVLVTKLASSPALRDSSASIIKLDFRILPIDSLENLRNVISYVNRNGFVVNSDHSPFSYPWGANRYFFNPEAKSRFQSCGTRATCVLKRNLFHSDRLAKVSSVIILDGYVSPACFCHIEEAESFFRSGWHYFHKVSRDVEAAKDIAGAIGESIFYNDDELFSVAASVSAKKFGRPSSATLSKEEKVEVARLLHYDYNATNKQVSRVLKIGIEDVNLLFPKKSV